MSNTNTIKHIEKGSPAEKAGLLVGDRIQSINDHPVHDELDLVYHGQDDMLRIILSRNRKKIHAVIEKDQIEDHGISLEPLKIRTCNNKCIFCFVSQLPKGLRRTLYVKDEDYRMSFLYGNYVTLSNLTASDRTRIVEQRMSPLYISVHTTNNELRRKMLGNPKSPDILKDIKYFTSKKIRFHAQIVLCPGYNDGIELERTIRDLSRFYPYMLSIAVVPVGLTRYSRGNVRPVEMADAIKAIHAVQTFSKRFRKKYGDPLVYAADELYIKANEKFPPLKEYGDLPQIENGVGMVPDFIQQSRYIKLAKYNFSNKRFLALTGTSFYPFLQHSIERITAQSGVTLRAFPVMNRFFGKSVTVTGLLTGRDVIHALKSVRNDGEVVIMPDVVLKDATDLLLDNVSIANINKATGCEIRIVESTITGLLKGMEEHYAYKC